MKHATVWRHFRRWAPVLLIAAVLASAASTAGGQEKFYPQPAPEPVSPPAGGRAPRSPMVELSRKQNYSAARISSYQRQGGPRDNIYVPTDGSEVTIAEIKGPGAITHIWTTHRTGGHDFIVRMYWEGSDHPSVEAPIGDFFGMSMGVNAPINSVPIQVSSEGRSRNCWWYMPFNRSAKVTVTCPPSEENTKKDREALYFYIDYRRYAEPIEDIHYFHVRFRETDPAQRGKPVVLAEMEGQGHFVGVVLGNRARTPGWFGEGDDIITVDGKVSFLGTGSEDYFGEAWGFVRERLFSDLYYGVPHMDERGVGCRSCAYRFHIADPIPFRTSFKFEMEHWPWLSPLPNSGRDYFSGTGFWYQSTIHKAWPRLEKIIANEPWDPIKGRWHTPGAIEAEELKVVGHESRAQGNPAPKVELVMPNLSGDHMLVFDAGGKGAFSVAVPVEESGTYAVDLYCPRAPDYGIVQVQVNERRIGDPIDIYLRRDDLVRPLWPPKAYAFANVPLKKGTNTFTFVVDSKNAESDGYKAGIDCLVLKKQK